MGRAQGDVAPRFETRRCQLSEMTLISFCSKGSTALARARGSVRRGWGTREHAESFYFDGAAAEMQVDVQLSEGGEAKSATIHEHIRFMVNLLSSDRSSSTSKLLRVPGR